MLKRAVVALMFILALPAPASALQADELLSLIEMPLAVALVSELTDIPMDPLMDVVRTLNAAEVQPTEFIQVVRYMPVALVVEDRTDDFVRFVTLRQQEGLRGDAFVTVVERELRTFDAPDITLLQPAPRIVDVTPAAFFPAVVHQRIAAKRAHPHGGPPGQLKKVAGVKTGAEIVHGSRPGARDDDKGKKVEVTVRDGDGKGKEKVKQDHGGGPPSHAKGEGAKGGGKGKGKGKGR